MAARTRPGLLQSPVLARPRSPFGARCPDQLNRREGEPRGRRHDEATARGRGPFRPSDPPLEPEDEALHLRRAQRHLHHRPEPDLGTRRHRLLLRARPRRRRRSDPLRRHEEADPGPGRRIRHRLRHALRQPALARRHAHQLPDGRRPGPQARRARGVPRRRRLRRHAEEGGALARARAREARAQPRRHAPTATGRRTRSS